MYKIQPHTQNQAKKLGVVVKPSTKSGKKIDIFKNNITIASVGATGYSDYATYLQTHGKTYADKRRMLYKKRHEKYRHIPDTNAYYADKLLW